MENIQIIATDLDGTLLNNNHQISEYNKNVIKEASKIGIKTILSTGRPTSAAHNFLAELHIDTELISFNGAMITDKYCNIVYQQNLDAEIGKELINIARKYNRLVSKLNLLIFINVYLIFLNYSWGFAPNPSSFIGIKEPKELHFLA